MLEQVRSFSKKPKKKSGKKKERERDVPATELAGEGQFLAKVAEAKTKKSFLYNKNYYLIDEELSSTHYAGSLTLGSTSRGINQ